MKTQKKVKISCNVSYSEENLVPFINNDLYTELNDIKTKIDQVNSREWIFCRNLLNDYEYICHKHPYINGNRKISIPYRLDKNSLHSMNSARIPMYENVCSRSFFKLWEIFNYHEKRMPMIKDTEIRCACLAEGPGGFIQSILEYRCEKPTKIYGITLKEGTQQTTKWNNSILNNENIILTNGDNERQHDGDLLNYDILEYFTNLVNKDGKVDLVTADGGYYINIEDENIKEQIHFPLFYNEAITALAIQKKGGCFVLKVYDMFTLPTCQLFTLLSMYYKDVYITKPLTSRPANSERYIVCLEFKGIGKKSLAKLLSTAKNMCMYGIRCKALLNGDEYIQTKTGNFIKSIFDSKYVNENIKNLLFNHNSEYVPNQIDDIYQIIDLINRMKYNDFNEIMNANSQIFKEYEEIQNIKAIEWCKRNKMPLNPEYSIKRYI
jgi:23S rRNA U2552 (ribose-2'-O)-methylase RlmE/FtsJ